MYLEQISPGLIPGILIRSFTCIFVRLHILVVGQSGPDMAWHHFFLYDIENINLPAIFVVIFISVCAGCLQGHVLSLVGKGSKNTAYLSATRKGQEGTAYLILVIVSTVGLIILTDNIR